MLVKRRPQFINSLTQFLHREDYFPLTLALSPIGERGKSETGLLFRKVLYIGGTGFPACVEEAGWSCTAWKGCATSQYQLFMLYGWA
jgi:hypothetical protein